MNEKHLREKSERKIEDDEFCPMREKCENRQIFPSIREVQKCRQKTHRGAHDSDRGVYDDRFENYGMSLARIEFAARQFERKRTSHRAFEQICEREFNQDNRPNWKRPPENRNAAKNVDCFDYAACVHAKRARALNERRAVQNVQAVKNVGMDGYQNRDECKHHSLKLISRHFFPRSIFVILKFCDQIYSAEFSAQTCVAFNMKCCCHIIAESKKSQARF